MLVAWTKQKLKCALKKHKNWYQHDGCKIKLNYKQQVDQAWKEECFSDLFMEIMNSYSNFQG